MLTTFTKSRPDEFLSELKNEYVRLDIAKKSFTTILTPEYFLLDGNSLSTSKIGAGSSEKFKKIYSPEHFIEEYVKIIQLLWRERLKTNIDLVPMWVKNPKYKPKNNFHPDFKDKINLKKKD